MSCIMYFTVINSQKMRMYYDYFIKKKRDAAFLKKNQHLFRTVLNSYFYINVSVQT